MNRNGRQQVIKYNDKCDGERRCSWYYAEAITSARGGAYLCKIAPKQHTFELQRNIVAVASRWSLLPCPLVQTFTQSKWLRKPTDFLRHNWIFHVIIIYFNKLTKTQKMVMMPQARRSLEPLKLGMWTGWLCPIWLPGNWTLNLPCR